MDPEARRFMWSIVGEIAAQKMSAVVLTTHSMDEAEALSTKMGIMVKGGKFKCMGSAQHIKHKFGTGFAIEIKVRTFKESELADIKARYVDSNGMLDLSCHASWLSPSLANTLNIAFRGERKENNRLRSLNCSICLLRIQHAMCRIFGEVDLIERFDNYMKIRVPRVGRTNGWLFGEVEAMKSDFDISEYSVSETTMEEIF